MFGRWFGWGRGFGFRGWSPPWPYVGLGRGGLPRCWYPGFWRGWYGYTDITKDEELSLLKEEAEYMKKYLAEIEARIKDLEAKK